MTTTTVTAKGQIVIPSRIRQHFNIRKGTRLCMIEKNNEIILQPLTREYFENTAGILKTNGRLTQALLNQRKQEKADEDKKWQKS